MEAENEKTHSFDDTQTKLSDSYLSAWPYRKDLQHRMEETSSCISSDSLPVCRGSRMFLMQAGGNRQHPCLFLKDREGGTETLLIDPDEYIPSSELDWFFVSPEGSYVAFGLSQNGDEQSVLHVYDAAKNHVLAHTADYCSFSHIAWMPDSSGFFFTKGKASDFEDESKYLYYYDLKSGISEFDALPETDPFITPMLSASGRYLAVNISWEKPVTSYIYDLEIRSGWKPFLKDLDGESHGFFHGELYIAVTTDQAPRARVLSRPAHSWEDRSTWIELIQESEAVIQSAAMLNGNLVLNELVDAHARIRIIDVDNKSEKLITLPGFGLIDSSSPDAPVFSCDGDRLLFVYTRFTQPSRLYAITQEGELESLSTDCSGNIEGLRTRLVHASGVPVFLVYRGDLDMSTSHPLLLQAYGGWNTTLAPAYINSGRTQVLPFVEAGGIYAYAAIRGGCELGRDWWLAGRREFKQNSFDDFYTAAQILIDQEYTTPEELAVMGASNGGLLTAAAVTQKPDLFKAAILEVPLTDMIRSLRGPYVSSYQIEYGNPDDCKDREVLASYSPLHTVQENTDYPSVYIHSGIHDIRVQIWNGRKMAAALQHASSSGNPVLFKAVPGGHGPGLSSEQTLFRRLDILSFIMMELGMEITHKETVHICRQ
jgi:prolyl oligopeptidase